VQSIHLVLDDKQLCIILCQKQKAQQRVSSVVYVERENSKYSLHILMVVVVDFLYMFDHSSYLKYFYKIIYFVII
jgi:hypothetical protein